MKNCLTRCLARYLGLPGLLTLACLLPGPAAALEPAPRVEAGPAPSLVLEDARWFDGQAFREGRLLVSFELAGAFNGEMRDTIRSGLQTTFSYDVRLRQEPAFWPDNTVASAPREATVRYDNLTEQFNVARTLDGRGEERYIREGLGEKRNYHLALQDFNV